MIKLLEAYLPMLVWGRAYSASKFRADAIAGVIVLFITVPQVIAYAFLAGMPPESGLYAAMFALVAYAFFGSSKALAVGPTAILAMMTLEVVSSYAEPGTAAYTQIATQLCVITGVLLLILRLVKFGSIISFLSHAVVTGFITAAAVLIITNQLPPLLGLAASPDTSIMGVASHLYAQSGELNLYVCGISLLAVTVLVFCKTLLGPLLLRIGVGEAITASLVKSSPMYVVIIGVLLVQVFSLHQTAAVPIVGAIPSTLPNVSISWVEVDQIRSLLPSALLIAMVIFMESISIGTALASKAREKINPNQELVGLGVANFSASLVGGFPVAGSFARSVVNFSSGAVSPMASLITASLVMLTILLFASVFYYLPKGVLSAIIVISAWQLIDISVIGKIFSFNVTDAVTFTFTFLAVLGFGVESGVLTGIAVSFVLLIRSSSKPHIAVVGRVGDTEHFRNVDRHDAKTSPAVLAVRVDESLYFVNTRYVETFVLNQVAESKQIDHVLLICTAMNFIDTSGLEMLEELSENLREVGVTLHLAEVKGPVMDKLKETSFYSNMTGQVFFTTDIAMKTLAGI